MAGVAVLVAALSHMIAGGNTPTIFALVATLIIALPLTTFLSGTRFGLLRTVAAVAVTQGLFHWLFVWIGSPEMATSEPTGPMPSHAEHLAEMSAAMSGSLASLADPVTAGVAMWISHAVAAALTVWMLRRGERALDTLQSVIADLFFPTAVAPVPAVIPEELPGLPATRYCWSPRQRLLSTSAITHRGPPARMRETRRTSRFTISTRSCPPRSTARSR